MKSFKSIQSVFCTVAFALLLTSATDVSAQKRTPASIKTHGRVDVIAGDFAKIHAGLGALLPFNNYFGVGGVAGFGFSENGASGRIDLYGRFSFDPFRRNSWEPYVGGGITNMFDTSPEGTRSHLLLFFGMNGPKKGRFAPGFEVGIGDGLRLGMTLRTSK